MTDPSDLFAVGVHGAGTVHVETITGYVVSLAKAHRVSTYSMLSLINKRSPFGNPKASSYLHHGGAPMVAYGLQQRGLLRVLEHVADVQSLRLSCMADLEAVFARNGSGVIHQMRHWCPCCFLEARSGGTPARDLLAWQIVNVSACYLHGVPLESTCRHCGNTQPHLPWSADLDICASCQVWLGGHRNRDLKALTAGLSTWALQQMPALLAARTRIRSLPPGAVEIFIRSYQKCHGLSVEALSNVLGLSFHTVAGWIKGRTKPTLSTWMRVCSTLNVRLVESLLNPMDACRQLSFNWIQRSASSAGKCTFSKPIYSKTDIRERIAQEIKKPTVKSIEELACAMQVPMAMLYYHNGIGLKELTTVLRNQSSAKRQALRLDELERARLLFHGMRTAGEVISRKAFIARLAEKAGIGTRRAKEIFTTVLAELRAERNV